ncbi:unnamed protein product [Fusarium graminearum]|uniref:Uncharacterized protein n=1 Tax=Gibberella zeae TaxID=5518 RepID=A0A4E9DVJ7_GIBZA|nr:unnamed protein product [Fusarium graminearum]CAG2000209.1 unnamed protein product [Fusarium graminearum]
MPYKSRKALLPHSQGHAYVEILQDSFTRTYLELIIQLQPSRSHCKVSILVISGDSLVVTDPTTNPPLTSLSMGERTGSRVL